MGIMFRGQLAGMIGLSPIDWANAKTSIGYWLGAEFEGRGIATRSCRALIDYLFKELKINRVEIRAKAVFMASTNSQKSKPSTSIIPEKCRKRRSTKGKETISNFPE